MISNFSQQHPWFTKKIKSFIWKFINRIGDFSYPVKLARQGLKIRINSHDDSVGKYVFLGTYEYETRIFSAKFLMAGDKVIDIGANIGFFSMLFANSVGEHGEVHSFEPSQREFFELCENIKVNNLKNIFANQIAIGNENGFTTLKVFENHRFGAYNSLGTIYHPFVRGAKTNCERIRQLRLDDYISLFQELKPQLIKIDVEGYEKQAIEGMQSLLNSEDAPCLVIEVCTTTRSGAENKTEALILFIESFGYSLFAPDREGNLISFEIGKSLNCIAIKPSHLPRIQERKILVEKKEVTKKS